MPCMAYVYVRACVLLSLVVRTGVYLLCQCCRLLMFVCLPPFETLSLLLDLVSKESELSELHCQVKLYS